MTPILRFSRFTQHLLTFILYFAHGGFVMAGVMVVGLVGYQLTQFGPEGLDPRAMFGYRATVSEADAATSELVDVVYAESTADQTGLSVGLNRVSTTIAKRYRVSPIVVESLVKAAQREGQANGIDPLLILAVITVESGFNPFSESVLGAQGLMQIIPRFHADKIAADKGAVALFDPAENIRVGAMILKAYQRSTGSVEAALQLYGGASGDSEMAYSAKVLQELDRLRQVAGLAVPARTAARGKADAGES
ncbi:transglycosylase SLT domain-containing protein [Uliginosibacterium sp. 31-16]|uniref:transglycosylase SLT domain-containing protein n=1 Tax=Uliginosibacterium sp. 31-16 TaxID=3068315 RepID=UPI0027402B8E|nr:transglycosylase SLT domain-containing protein [Uliginosibacterium sp. 31-16]MDP5240188.1 transglycosylase SLT domain-containing protein [Uliginosibacterium sp. 31-16]